jgi:hypothetical protein
VCDVLAGFRTYLDVGADDGVMSSRVEPTAEQLAALEHGDLIATSMWTMAD